MLKKHRQPTHIDRNGIGPWVKLNWEALLKTSHQRISLFRETFSNVSFSSDKGHKKTKKKSTHKTPCCEASEGILLRRKGLAGEQ